jgi:hypothetical protein
MTFKYRSDCGWGLAAPVIALTLCSCADSPVVADLPADYARGAALIELGDYQFKGPEGQRSCSGTSGFADVDQVFLFDRQDDPRSVTTAVVVTPGPHDVRLFGWPTIAGSRAVFTIGQGFHETAAPYPSFPAMASVDAEPGGVYLVVCPDNDPKSVAIIKRPGVSFVDTMTREVLDAHPGLSFIALHESSGGGGGANDRTSYLPAARHYQYSPNQAFICQTGDCLNGSGSGRWRNGELVSGQFKDGKANGRCEIWYPVGDSYQGACRNGVKSGPGRYTWSDGRSYTGPFVEDRMAKGALPPSPPPGT